MTDLQLKLKNMEPKHKFLVAVDSDGCAFDTMEIKHKECFTPNTIKYWNLQPISKYARQAADFVNLYSKWRGTNRFPALVKVFDLLEEWDEVKARNVAIPTAKNLRNYINSYSNYSNPSLKLEADKTGHEDLKQAFAWSEAVNATIGDMVHGVPPFPNVKASLEKVSEFADIIVCSATPNEALEREWAEHGLAQYISVIGGQEMGSKQEILALVKDKYPENHILMVGDAPGDKKAAHSNDILFYPIVAGKEEDSWKDFLNKYSEVFTNNKYTKDIEDKLIEAFEDNLPERPPWK